MAKRIITTSSIVPTKIAGYDAILTDVVKLLEQARRTTARVINAAMTATYWQIGRRIVEWEQDGRGRAAYGEVLVKRLGEDLKSRFGRGFSWRNLYLTRNFYEAYPEILQTASAKLKDPENEILQKPSAIFSLPWSHYVRLISLRNPNARNFYETEAIRGGWSIRQLDRQINSSFYERTAMSRNKAAMLAKGATRESSDIVSAEEEIKDPFVLEFLSLKDEYSEADIEEALILHLESFLLELGGDFAFIGRQRRLRIGDQWFRIDLLFFHRKLRCLVIIDLKNGPFTHADAGQMRLYCNYAAEHWTNEGKNPPVGLILCEQKNAAVAHYALDNLPNKILAAEYRMVLPNEQVIAEELQKTRKLLENRSQLVKRKR